MISEIKGPWKLQYNLWWKVTVEKVSDTSSSEQFIIRALWRNFKEPETRFLKPYIVILILLFLELFEDSLKFEGYL